jgi:hypothetical protein
MVDMEDVVTNLQKGERLAAEVQASAPGRRAWVIVLAYKRSLFAEVDPNFDPQRWKYRIRWIEVDTEYILEGVEVPAFAVHVTHDLTLVDDLNQLEGLLFEWVGAPTRLKYPNQCGLPLI